MKSATWRFANDGFLNVVSVFSIHCYHLWAFIETVPDSVIFCHVPLFAGLILSTLPLWSNYLLSCLIYGVPWVRKYFNVTIQLEHDDTPSCCFELSGCFLSDYILWSYSVMPCAAQVQLWTIDLYFRQFTKVSSICCCDSKFDQLIAMYLLFVSASLAANHFKTGFAIFLCHLDICFCVWVWLSTIADAAVS